MSELLNIQLHSISMLFMTIAYKLPCDMLNGVY